jgi:hypothetical protein
MVAASESRATPHTANQAREIPSKSREAIMIVLLGFRSRMGAVWDCWAKIQE